MFQNEMMAVPDNSTSAVPYEWEYYYDYLDPVIVDESKLKYNKCTGILLHIMLYICLLVLHEGNTDSALCFQTQL